MVIKMVDSINITDQVSINTQTWDDNVKNCSIPIERSVMISDDKFNAEWCALEAGVILGTLDIDKYKMQHCGVWHWLEFENEEDAVAFKLKWE